MGRSVFRSALIIVSLYGVYLVLFSQLQRSVIFPRHWVKPLKDAGVGIPRLETVWIDTPEGRVEAWFIPAPQASAQTPMPVVIFAHGNGELIDYWPRILAPYGERGFSVLLPEYRGYGRSAGKPTQVAITDDFTAFYDWLVAREDVDRNTIVFHGRSLGGAVVVQLAQRQKPHALILESTFTSICDFAARFLVPRSLVSDPFDSEALLPTLTHVPILILHGTHDSVVPFDHARRLKQAAATATLISYEADHNDFPPNRLQYWSDIFSFLSVR